MNTGELTTPESPRKAPPFQFSLRKFIGMLVVVALVASCVATLKRAVERTREAAIRSTCAGCKMGALALACQDYLVKNRTLPPAYVPGPDGKPAHSWRVLILPQIEESGVYGRYRFSEPWNGPNNRQLESALMGDPFSCPGDPEAEQAGCTSYVAVVGERTLWPGARARRSDELRHGGEAKIVLIEIPYSKVSWMEPKDFTVEDAVDLFRRVKGGRIETQHYGDLHYITLDRKYGTLSSIESEDEFRRMLELDSKETKP